MWRAILLGSMLAAACVAQTVEGHVVSSATGIDVPGVAVNLVRDGRNAYSATTDARGGFRIEGVEAGTYMAVYLARGFWQVPNFVMDEDFERECGRCFLTERGGQPFPVTAGGDPVRLDVKMAPIGKISGRVLDPLGNPVPDASLQFHWGENWLCRMPSCSGIFRQVKTNEKGEYSVTDLDLPGAWLVSATAPASWKLPESRDDRPLGWAETFYPGVTDPQLSVRVTTGSGGETANLDIKLATVPVHRIRGVVLDDRGNPVPEAAVTLSQRIGSPALGQHTRSDGTFEFDSAAEGDWRISAKVDQARPPLWTSRWVQVKAHDPENVELRPAAPFTLQGKVVMEVPEGAPDPQSPNVILAFHPGAGVPSDKPAGAILTGRADASGVFQVQNVYAGRYQILPEAAPPRYYLDSIRIGSYDALGSGIEIVSGAQPLTVTYKTGGGTVRGNVEHCGGGTVKLLPHEKSMRRPGFVWFAACDANDRYEITAVRPGEYFAIAIAGNSLTPWYAALHDDEGLIRNAGTVTVRAEESTSADLRAIRQ